MLPWTVNYSCTPQIILNFAETIRFAQCMELTLPSQSVPKMLIANYNTALGEPWENLDVLRLPRILAMEIQIRLVSAHFFKVFFESYWLWGYSVIRSEPPKNSSPGDSTFLMREKSLWDVNYFQKICPWKLVILVIRLLVLWDWVVMDQLEEAGPDNSCVQSYLVIWWIVIHVPLGVGD